MCVLLCVLVLCAVGAMSAVGRLTLERRLRVAIITITIITTATTTIIIIKVRRGDVSPKNNHQ